MGHSNPVAATTLFTASDADGDSIVQYDFWDNGQAGGHWLLNGNALPIGQDNFVPASQLSQVTYRGGAGTETIWERASDGIQFGAWVSINATGTDTAPVVAPTSASVVVSHNSSVAATTPVHGVRPGRRPHHPVRFLGQRRGRRPLVHQRQRAGKQREIIVNASQLSQVTYTPGAGTDTLFVRANDGIQWSAWTIGLHRHRHRAGLDPGAQLVSGAGGKTYAVSDLFTASDADGEQRPSTISGTTAQVADTGSSATRRREAIRKSWSTHPSSRRSPTRPAQAPTRSTCAPRTACISGPGHRG